MQHFHRWYCFPAASCLQTKPYAAIQLQIHRSFFWLWGMERRFKGILCWPGSTVALLQSHGGNPASHPWENQMPTDCFHSKKQKRNFVTPFSPRKKLKKNIFNRKISLKSLLFFLSMGLETSVLWPSRTTAHQTEVGELLQLNNLQVTLQQRGRAPSCNTS